MIPCSKGGAACTEAPTKETAESLFSMKIERNGRIIYTVDHVKGRILQEALRDAGINLDLVPREPNQ